MPIEFLQKWRSVQSCLEARRKCEGNASRHCIFWQKSLDFECKCGNIARGVLFCRLLAEFEPLECTHCAVALLVDLAHWRFFVQGFKHNILFESFDASLILQISCWSLMHSFSISFFLWWSQSAEAMQCFREVFCGWCCTLLFSPSHFFSFDDASKSLTLFGAVMCGSQSFHF